MDWVPANRTEVLPACAIRTIIAHAWKMTGIADERWSLHEQLSAAHPLLQETLHVIIRFPRFKFGPSSKDIDLCELAVRKAASAANAKGEKVYNPLLPLLYQRSHVTLDFSMLFDDVYGPLHLDHWDSYMEELREVLLDCTSATAVPQDSVLFRQIHSPLHTLQMAPQNDSLVAPSLPPRSPIPPSRRAPAMQVPRGSQRRAHSSLSRRSCTLLPPRKPPRPASGHMREQEATIIPPWARRFDPLHYIGQSTLIPLCLPTTSCMSITHSGSLCRPLSMGYYK
ncbi:hypothetical protein BD309DRAFT_966819 [Dichomitus squalens]|uniref:Uncharacterized protein n=1 Tax=Dichomitus squalens TaxID=114155 RepID=A0A4Q9NLK3_9APHY|nr:hypothetical protein BD309DRAFT_966819 [Dichomitus squalens]TBU53586.1 hypothetical protein BD310DRAFT_139851 [Dichomitus squalens]